MKDAPNNGRYKLNRDKGKGEEYLRPKIKKWLTKMFAD